MLTEPETIMSAGTGPVMSTPQVMQIRIDANDMAVRQTLGRVSQFLHQAQVPETETGQVEIVLAEALNNIVEHAYDGASGWIDVRCKVEPDQIHLTLLDMGVPVPMFVLTKRTGPATDVQLEDLPEGGFGWMLIQTMTRHLSYQRVGGVNCLGFTVPRGLDD